LSTRPKPYTADRTVTRNLLLSGLESHVSFNKRLVRYEAGENDTIVAFFADNTSAQGQLIVGAEGIRSVVRRQHIPNHVILDTNFRCIYGKTKLTPELESCFNANALKHITVISDQPAELPLVLFLEPVRFQINEMRDDLPADYVYWVLAGDRSRMLGTSDGELFKMSSKEAAQFSLKLTQGWHRSVRPLLEMQDEGMTSVLKTAITSPDFQTWKPSSTVTLVGDSVHVVPPTGALGANTALQDAASLTRALQKGITLEAIADYENDMQNRARNTIGMSATGARHLLGFKDVQFLKPISFS
jgi:2-polyprenyl-6-methoxyphenol hydroxylase-like FAD-dependent oxidoreductase